MELYFNWHLVGSGLLDGEEEDGGEEVKRALAKVLTCPDLEWFRGQAEQWVTLEEDGAIKGSADKMLFIRKMDAKIFSRTDKFVGSSTRSAGLAAMDEHNMGATYLFDDRVRGAEDCFMEITATLIGAGNYPISVPPGTVGMADKIWDLTPEYIFVNEARGSTFLSMSSFRLHFLTQSLGQ